MNMQELLERVNFLEDEVHRCYAEIEDYEIKIKERDTEIAGLEKILKQRDERLTEYKEVFDKIKNFLEAKCDSK